MQYFLESGNYKFNNRKPLMKRNKMTSFLMISLLIALALPALARHGNQPADQQKGPFVHTVFFWLKNPDSQADQQKLLEGLKMIKEIEHIKEGYIGVPASTSRDVIDGSYDFSITFIFENMGKEQAYQTHPVHLKFVDEYAQLWDRVLVYDAVPPEN